MTSETVKQHAIRYVSLASDNQPERTNRVARAKRVLDRYKIHLAKQAKRIVWNLGQVDYAGRPWPVDGTCSAREWMVRREMAGQSPLYRPNDNLGNAQSSRLTIPLPRSSERGNVNRRNRNQTLEVNNMETTPKTQQQYWLQDTMTNRWLTKDGNWRHLPDSQSRETFPSEEAALAAGDRLPQMSAVEAE